MVECHASDLIARVRFPLPAPTTYLFELFIEQIDIDIILKKDGIFLFEQIYCLAEPPCYVPLVITYRGLGLVAKPKSYDTKKIQEVKWNRVNEKIKYLIDIINIWLNK